MKSGTFTKRYAREAKWIVVAQVLLCGERKLANIIEYGKPGQPARPFLARAKRQVKKPCEAAMKAKFEEEIKKL